MEEKQRIPPRMNSATLDAELTKIGQIIARLADKDIFSWLDTGQQPTDTEIHRAATIVADRLCGALADPIIRNILLLHGNVSLFMDKRPKIIKRRQPEISEETTLSDSSLESSEASAIESVEVPAPPEQLEVLYVQPALNSATYSDWQQEFREIKWDLEQEDWESLMYD